MWDVVVQFAEAENSGVFDALGIDWTALILQIISFVILVVIVSKFIYPPIVAMLDRHDKKIENALKAAEEAQANASKSEAESAELLEKSRNEAADILESAKQESAEIILQAEKDASARAETVMADARAGLEREIEQARQDLRDEMVGLVSLATEKIIDTRIEAKDEKLIKTALKEYER
ncbi:F0F1 ATP synthase subunit B [Candidatus Saccharibacteria bacterium]|nr:F0F1 ATP synthase subunit B [Candidatus Saccharibacteria bacterium]